MLDQAPRLDRTAAGAGVWAKATDAASCPAKATAQTDEKRVYIPSPRVTDVTGP